MKKIIKVYFIILIALVLVLVGYIVYDKVVLNNKINKIANNSNPIDIFLDTEIDQNFNNSNNINIMLDTEISQNANTINVDNMKENISDSTKYEKISSFKLNLNGIEHNLYYKYFLVEGDSSYTDPDDIKKAKDFGYYVYYTLKVDVYIDENKVKTIPLFYTTTNNKNEVQQYKQYIGKLNETNVKILKGTDNKDYLVYLIKEGHKILNGRIIPFISNSDGKLLYEFDFPIGGSKWVVDPASKLYNQKDNEDGKEYLIEEDKIYFLTLGYIEMNNRYYQENILTINNDTINIEKGDFYQGTGAGIIK